MRWYLCVYYRIFTPDEVAHACDRAAILTHLAQAAAQAIPALDAIYVAAQHAIVLNADNIYVLPPWRMLWLSASSGYSVDDIAKFIHFKRSGEILADIPVVSKNLISQL